MTRNCSYHCTKDRIERLTFIATTIGFGNIIQKAYNTENDTWTCVTDTGVIEILSNGNKNFVVTAFIANYNQIYRVYRINHQNMPKWLQNTVRKNEKRKLIEMQEKA